LESVGWFTAGSLNDCTVHDPLQSKSAFYFVSFQ